MTLLTPAPAQSEASAYRYWHPRHVEPTAKAAAVRRILALARTSLAMEVGYFGTFDDGAETYAVVDGPGGKGTSFGPRQGTSLAVDQTLCWQVVTGQIGSAVPDTHQEPVTRDLPPVTDSGVHAYLGVPVHHDNELLGMLCLVSSEARPDLGTRQVELMRLLAQVVALELAPDAEGNGLERELEQLHAVLEQGSSDLTVVFQPVARIDARLRDGSLEVRSVEALSRFGMVPAHPVEFWFGLAWRQGLGVDLEMTAIDRAFAALPSLPEGIRLAVNASPETLASSRLRDSIPLDQAHRITVELTEHVMVDGYDTLRPALERVRELGVSLAIDDLGTGSSNLQQIIELAPELIKVDLSITDGVEHDARRRAMISALVSFTREVGITLVTEGIERVATARTLDRLGVRYGQGYWLSRAVSERKLPGLLRYVA